MNSNIQTSERRDAQAQSGAARDSSGREQPFVIPPVDVFENESGITLLADLPGASRDGLNVRVDGDTLTIEATAHADSPQRMQLLYSEASWPSYRRSFTLSRELDCSRIDANLKDGVLRLTIPKTEEARPRRIDVRVG